MQYFSESDSIATIYNIINVKTLTKNNFMNNITNRMMDNVIDLQKCNILVFNGNIYPILISINLSMHIINK
jgi:hypothetical protein